VEPSQLLQRIVDVGRLVALDPVALVFSNHGIPHPVEALFDLSRFLETLEHDVEQTAVTQKTVSRGDVADTADEVQKAPADFGGQRLWVGQHAGHEIVSHALLFIEDEAIELLSHLKLPTQHCPLNCRLAGIRMKAASGRLS
jgi:hypothetical protein